MGSNVLVLGKGQLAARVVRWFAFESAEHDLVAIVPVAPEPVWDRSLSSLIAASPLDGCAVVASGDYRDVPGDLKIDLAVSIFYDRILSADFIARCGRALNLHNAPLPRYRGVSPINWALKNGEREHGVTIHELTPEIDAGPIVSQVKFSIWPGIDEVRDVYERCLAHGWRLFYDTIRRLDRIEAAPQDASQATYHSRNQDTQLGDRRGWTRRLSTNNTRVG